VQKVLRHLDNVDVYFLNEGSSVNLIRGVCLRITALNGIYTRLYWCNKRIYIIIKVMYGGY
jgi:hypothetical protein